MTDQRMDAFAVAPDAYKAVMGLESYARRHVDHDLYELIKLRASIDNGCSFCVDMHTTDWLGAGADVRRVVAVAAWRESSFFSDRERVVLELTDQVTELGEHGVTDEVWDAAVEELGDELLVNVLMAIAAINVWNRLAVPTRRAAPPLAAA